MDTNKPNDVKQLVVDARNPKSLMHALRYVLGARRFGQARMLLAALKQLKAKGVAVPKEDGEHPIALLAAHGFYREATWLTGSYEKYSGLGGQLVHLGNAFHTSLQETTGAQWWEDFFTQVTSPEQVVAELFDKSMTARHKAAVDQWRKDYPDPDCITFGSCFAREIANAVANLGFQSETLHLEESVNTPRATVEILNLIDGGAGNEYLKERLHGREHVIRNLLQQANLIVTTVGVGFYYVDRDDRLYVGDGYGSKLKAGEIRPVFPSVEEHIGTILEIHDKLMAANKQALKVLTLSPVPLSGYIGEPGMFVADCVSKSLLRAAIHGALDKTSFVYLPTFEALKWIAPHMPVGANYRPFLDSRHPNDVLVNAVLRYLLPQKGGSQAKEQLA